jgi:hypothetical protein|tara:strand:- start:683 stop:901 length:219 start_codon:yes stop_codon:yes gene_type:complete
MMIDLMLLIKVVFLGSGLVGCGYYLGRDKGVRTGAGDAVDMLCEKGYLNFRRVGKNSKEIELIKLNGEVEES